MLAWYMLWPCLSIRHKSEFCKNVKHRITQIPIMPHSPGSVLQNFVMPKILTKFQCSYLQWGAKYRWGKLKSAIFNQYIPVKRKGKEEYLYSAFYILCISESAQAWITQFYMQIHHVCLFL